MSDKKEASLALRRLRQSFGDSPAVDKQLDAVQRAFGTLRQQLSKCKDEKNKANTDIECLQKRQMPMLKKIEELGATINVLQSEIDKLKKEISSKDVVITRLKAESDIPELHIVKTDTVQTTDKPSWMKDGNWLSSLIRRVASQVGVDVPIQYRGLSVTDFIKVDRDWNGVMAIGALTIIFCCLEGRVQWFSEWRIDGHSILRGRAFKTLLSTVSIEPMLLQRFGGNKKAALASGSSSAFRNNTTRKNDYPEG